MSFIPINRCSGYFSKDHHRFVLTTLAGIGIWEILPVAWELVACLQNVGRTPGYNAPPVAIGITREKIVIRQIRMIAFSCFFFISA
jgi:hypothetical protein